MAIGEIAYFLKKSFRYVIQEEESRQIALLEEVMKASPSILSAVSEQLLKQPDFDNISLRSGLQEPRHSFSMIDSRGNVVHH